MEDVIYILLAVAWVVFSVVKGSKKKDLTPTTTRPKSQLEEIFGDFFPHPVEPEVEYESLEDIQPEEVEPFNEFDEKYKKYMGILDQETTSLEEGFYEHKMEALDQNREQQNEYDHGNFRSAFNLRQAMIYQVLLQRPDY